ncbi:hypothetical protein Pcinc_012811 [Petrolisthes cinctipes]|uniref:Uncharacterized protein n=1 Tax=Petrolisthes cinctipes TaxID=88211 RepID=A0AAE1G0G3_PETCI|nr:hypothetical protein Pcinc_012811 [Petrolisthes cinctipes]
MKTFTGGEEGRKTMQTISQQTLSRTWDGARSVPHLIDEDFSPLRQLPLALCTHAESVIFLAQTDTLETLTLTLQRWQSTQNFKGSGSSVGHNGFGFKMAGREAQRRRGPRTSRTPLDRSHHTHIPRTSHLKILEYL